jgi:hypothetical protein
VIWTDIVRTRGRTDDGSEAHGRPCVGARGALQRKPDYDQDVKGFGRRVTAAGARSFILNYRTRGGRERRFTTGRFPEWKTAAVLGEDRLRRSRPSAPPRQSQTFATGSSTNSCLASGRRHRATTKAAIETHIRPALKHVKVADVTFSDIDGLHRKITKGGQRGRGAPYVANRAVAILSKMFSQAIKWGWRTASGASTLIGRA